MTGPPVSAAFGADGKLTPAGAGFARSRASTDDQIERIKTPKGEYIGVRKHQRGKAAVDVLPDVLTGVLRGMSFPKQMRWDALLERRQGRAAVRPADSLDPVSLRRPRRAVHDRPHRRWRRARACRRSAPAPSTYGHRFLTTSGRAGRAVKVKSFDDYRKRLAEHFVILDRSERHDRIARELDAEARRRGGRIARSLVGQGMLDEVPDLVEYPVVVSGAFARRVPAAARRSADDDDDSPSAFLSDRRATRAS